MAALCDRGCAARAIRFATLATLAALALPGVATAPAAGDTASAAGFTSIPARGVGHQGPCPSPARSLVPSGGATLIYRILNPWDVERLARLRTKRPMDFPIQGRDLFLVRATAVGLTAARRMVDLLQDRRRHSGELFRCNRIIAMTGAGVSPGREYVYNLASNRKVWSVGVDWERLMFDNAGRGSQWTDQFAPNVSALSGHAAAIRRAGRLAGALPAGWHGWDHGQLARRAGLDYQVVQTQDECRAGVQSYESRARRLLAQYRAAGMPISSLAMQVSFNMHPRSTPFRNDVGPAQAAACTAAAYDVGVRGFLLWAPPDAIDDYYEVLPNGVRGTGCTLNGTAGRDVLRGTGHSDVICGLKGADRIYGLGGNDTLIGGAGNDRLFGGSGNDWLRGGPGDDRLDGEAGFDLCAKGVGRDLLAIGCDRISPKLKATYVVTPTVDARAAPAAVVVAFRITDDMAGAGRVTVRFRSPSGTRTLSGSLEQAAPYAGTRRDGYYALVLQVPRKSEPGTWVLDHAAVWDRAGNSSSVGPSGIPAALAGRFRVGP